MVKPKTDFWHALSSYAKRIRLDSVYIGPAQFRLSLPDERTPAFAQIRERIESLHEREHDVFVISAHNVDEVTIVDRIDADHECEAFGNPSRVAGGSGANTAYALARLGARVGVSGIVGDDKDGAKLRSELEAVSADTRAVLMSSELPTGKTITLVDRGGRRLIVVFPGINNRYAALTDEQVLLERAQSSKIVHLSSFAGASELRLQQRLAERAGSHSIISLTPGALYARQGLDRLEALLRHVDLLFLYREQLLQLVENSSAASLLQGNRTIDLLESFFAWRRKNRLSSPVLLLVKDPKENPAGAVTERYLSVAVGASTLEQYVAPQQLPKEVNLRAVDTTGSGDAATAGFLYSMLHLAPLGACIDFSFLMAAFASSELGPRTAYQASDRDALIHDVQGKLDAHEPEGRLP